MLSYFVISLIRSSDSLWYILIFSAAAGRLDAMAELGVKEWDVCAGVLIIEEAGGAVMNFDKSYPVKT